ncbi:hypothetical protein DFQ27_000992 [Actinomortierella ambigua]|uniref:FHA domain-containing protein n=1 Tax=Actinomortierella ambigua TaxID=1343610 RepID=A0A9P6QNG2_9FUNG|nr:hypothetical protein DFQ27_000992 [Actinomortierella ambigua]
MSDTACIFTYLASGLEIRLPINGQLVLGRGTILDIKAIHMSRRQVEITSVNRQVYITRQGTNKSLLNGTELHKGRSTELKDGDCLTLLEKEYPIKVSIPPAPAKATLTPSVSATSSSSTTPVPSGVAASSVKKSSANGVEQHKPGEQDAAVSNHHSSASGLPSVTPVPSEANSAAAAAAAAPTAPPAPAAAGAQATTTTTGTTTAAAPLPQPLSVAAEASEMEVAHQLQADVRKERQQQQQQKQQAETNSVAEDEKIESAKPLHASTTTTTKNTKTKTTTDVDVMASELEDADMQEDGPGRSSESESEHGTDSGLGRNNRRASFPSRRKEGHDSSNSNGLGNDSNKDDLLASGDDDAVMVGDYLSDESSFVCSDLSDLEAEGNDGHFGFAKIHKIKRQGRVEVLH